MSSDQIFVGLEIGTTKICVVVAEGKSEDQISILGVGETPSRGIRKGEIVDMATATECVREAILDAEEKANVEIGNVWVAITGGHLRSLNNRGIHVLPQPRQIEQEDLDLVQTNAKEIAIPPQNIFLHTILQSYHLDGNRNVTDPLESEGMQLEADFHIVHGIKTRIHNTLLCVESLKLEIEDVVLGSLASAQVVVTQHQKDLGVIVIDMGGGTSDYLVYQDGAVRHSAHRPKEGRPRAATHEVPGDRRRTSRPPPMAGGSRARAPIRGGGDEGDAGVPSRGPPGCTAPSDAHHGLKGNGGATPIWDNTAVQHARRGILSVAPAWGIDDVVATGAVRGPPQPT